MGTYVDISLAVLGTNPLEKVKALCPHRNGLPSVAVESPSRRDEKRAGKVLLTGGKFFPAARSP